MAQGMSQTALAEAFGVTKQSVSNWKNNNILPSIEMLVNIARVFHVSIDHLLGLDDRRNIDAAGFSLVQAAHVQSIVNSMRPTGRGMDASADVFTDNSTARSTDKPIDDFADKGAERPQKLFTPVVMKPRYLVLPGHPKRDSLRERIMAAIDRALGEE